MTELSSCERTIECRWVFKIKDNTNPPTFKAGVVAQVLKSYLLLRTIQVGGTSNGSALLNGDLAKEIMMVPGGVNAPENIVCRLRKSLYGLKLSESDAVVFHSMDLLL